MKDRYSVYGIIEGGECVYVGCTKNTVLQRARQHTLLSSPVGVALGPMARLATHHVFGTYTSIKAAATVERHLIEKMAPFVNNPVHRIYHRAPGYVSIIPDYTPFIETCATKRPRVSIKVKQSAGRRHLIRDDKWEQPPITHGYGTNRRKLLSSVGLSVIRMMRTTTALKRVNNEEGA